MKCFYINLDSANERKLQIERNFLENKGVEWSMSRYAAVDARYIENQMIPGSLSPSEKACFLSHKNLIKENSNSEDPFLIMEDDAIFGKHTCAIVKSILSSGLDFDWDILFTDVAVPRIETMSDLVKRRQRLTLNNEVISLNLADMIFLWRHLVYFESKIYKKDIGLYGCRE